ncbi:peptidase domain-containing ABC transporter [Qipengyuania aquimaris]|uniref:peptidase domain-containing ABC transporter n=1 Tax=Qipengyuania aquimaris TaxID=255984 RepID=UPI001CD7F12B|nr:peptidase domain-containing ABC transporter [Qipengyuania aquimaris]MCA0903899.1 peptidase domain-containing ABC transporter [Qipengyuania aquimaris]
MSMDLINLTGRPTTPFIAQDEGSECALACIAMVAGYHGLKTDIQTLRRQFGISLRGATLKQMLEVCEQLKLNARPVRCEVEDLAHLALPAILHWDLSHFVVLTKVQQGIGGPKFTILDPGTAERKLTAAEMSDSFTGVAVEIRKAENFRQENQQRKLKISNLWGSISGLWSNLRNILIVSLVMQLVALSIPFFTQIAIDTIIPSYDYDLLGVLAIGFGMLALIGLAANWLRGLIIASLNAALSYQIIVNLFRHLTSLPLTWFEKRHVGDIVSRFGSTKPISQLLSQGMVAAFVDGILAVLTFILMIVYSPLLSAIGAGALILYGLIRWAFLRAIKLRNVDVITTAAKENSVFMETVRGASAIKAFAQESNRMRMWQRSKADAVNAEIKLARLTSVFDALASFIPTAERVLFLYVAVLLVLDAQLTVGMIFAYQAYKSQFLDAGIRLIEQAVNFRILQVHLGRISDIALSEPEEQRGQETIERLDELEKGVLARGIRFRFSPTEDEVLAGANLYLPKGAVVAMVGPSGGGKTTLLKVMAGLLEPSGGQVLVDRTPLKSIAHSSWRKSIGFVAQEDKLFAGSLGENIGFFDPMLDMERVREVAKIAHIHDEIEKFAMGYETRVGDMGSTLSGGQKQRILLARALYHRPQVLFLDEATAHLDHHLEGEVLKSLKETGVTVLMVAHRGQSIAAADELFHVAMGRVRRAEKTPDPAAKSAENRDEAEPGARPEGSSTKPLEPALQEGAL